MYGMYLGTWPTHGRSEEDRDAVHRFALEEARIASDYRGWNAFVAKPGLIARLREQLGGRTQAVAPCAACPA